jgi:DsbC/DsbD-like thiol-disulfide interchange protein
VRLMIGITLMLLSGVPLAFAAENRVQAKLLADVESAVVGESFRVGVYFEIPERAHIYWRNPGDSGLATEIQWDVSGEAVVGELQWPVPKQFELEGLNEAYFGYTEETVLFSEFTIEAGDEITINAEVSWLLCLDDGVCIPEDAELTLTIPVHEESRKAYTATLFEEYATKVPESDDDMVGLVYSVSIGPNSQPPTVSIQFMGDWRVISGFEGFKPAFYPYTGGAWVHSLKDDELRFEASYKKDDFAGGVIVAPIEHSSGRRQVRALRVADVE